MATISRDRLEEILSETLENQGVEDQIVPDVIREFVSSFKEEFEGIVEVENDEDEDDEDEDDEE